MCIGLQKGIYGYLKQLVSPKAKVFETSPMYEVDNTHKVIIGCQGDKLSVKVCG